MSASLSCYDNNHRGYGEGTDGQTLSLSEQAL